VYDNDDLIQLPIDAGCSVAFVLPESRIEAQTFERMIRWLQFLQQLLRDDEGDGGESEAE
jgi:hypothetical protein